MKLLPLVFPLILLLLLGGALLALRSIAVDRSLIRDNLETLQAQHRAVSTDLERLTIERDAIAAELLSAKAVADKRATELETSLAKALAERKAGQQSETTTRELLAATTAMDNAFDMGIQKAGSRVTYAEMQLDNKPTESQFADLKQSYTILGSAIEEASTRLNECQRLFRLAVQESETSSSKFSELEKRIEARANDIISLRQAHEGLAKAARIVKFTAIANESGWQSNNATVEAGESMAIATKGRWQWAQALTNSETTAEGTNGSGAYRIDGRFNNGALLIRVRGASEINSGSGTIRAARSGQIEFRINDTLTNDNSGQIDITVFIFRPLTAAIR